MQHGGSVVPYTLLLFTGKKFMNFANFGNFIKNKIMNFHLYC